MSNYEAGRIYEAVIDEVIADSRQDFEDSGIDESTLQELKRLWCEKLSQSKVCSFSWEEENELNRHIHRSAGGATMKSEALQLNAGLDIPNINPYQTSSSLRDSHLVNSESGGYGMGIEIPSVKQEFDDSGLILPKVNQSDGSFELSVQLTERKTQETLSLLKNKLMAQADGSSLLDEDDDDIFNDSDDINSDLDDDLDSEKSDDDDADQEGQIMLCLYDKVQRVKNKWKCNLKEGVANIDGRDYVFQRATGESEW